MPNPTPRQAALAREAAYRIYNECVQPLLDGDYRLHRSEEIIIAALGKATQQLLQACQRSLPEIANCGDHDLVRFVESAIRDASNPQAAALNTASSNPKSES